MISSPVACHYWPIAAVPPLPEVEAHMPQARRNALRRLLRQDDKLRCAAAWLLLRSTLGSRAKQIRLGRYGKPFLPGGPYFSLAHAGQYALLALAPLPVGVDIEEIRPEIATPDLLRQICHPEELASCDATKIFAIWTCKESYLKMRGTGLMENPAAFALRWQGDCPQIPSRPVRFALYHHLPGHIAAICLLGAQPPETITPGNFPKR